MDPCVSGEDLVIKTRKPYTITKQREKWTEEEHNRFLEALKLYGRAWQRIEEHIGTKTAIQIRSHAQKFFTKLEKESAVKGAGNTLDIEIPPPRPKRKPANPYPRKTGGAPVLQLGLKDGRPSDATSTSLCMAFVKEAEDLSDDAKQQNSDPEKDDCTEALSFDTVAPCASPTSTNSSLASEASERSCTFREFIPLVNGSHNQNGRAELLCTAEPLGNHAEEKHFLNDTILNSTVAMDFCVSPEESSHGEMVHDPIDESSHNCPRHVPVHILGGSFGSMPHPPDMPFMQSRPNQTCQSHGDQTVFTDAAASATSENGGNGPRTSTPQPYLHCHPFFAPMLNPEDYQSFLQISSTFSSLILSALAQNAAMYAAASFASSVWPWFNLEAPLEPSANSSGIHQSRPMNPTSSMVAIAGATVAAATAWWAANGLLPLCPQYHPGFACSPAAATAAQMDGTQSGNINGDARENSADPMPQYRQPDPEHTNAPSSTWKPPTSLSSDSEASEAGKLNGGLNPSGSAENEKPDGSNKFKNRKQLDRSSSGSNTLSTSDIEPDAMEVDVKVTEEKHIQVNEDNYEPDAVLDTPDPSSRRSRSNSSLTDPWREVSEEGRLAFQALFSREVLPQSFPPPHDLENKAKKHCIKPGEDGDEPTIFKLDSNQVTANSSFFTVGMNHDGLLNKKIGNAKAQTGFRLYKRCAVEATETRVPDEHKDPKKLRL